MLCGNHVWSKVTLQDYRLDWHAGVVTDSVVEGVTQKWCSSWIMAQVKSDPVVIQV